MADIFGLVGSQSALGRFDRASSLSERNRTTAATGLPLTVLPPGTRSQASNYTALSAASSGTLVAYAGSAAQSVDQDLAELRRIADQARSAAVQAGVADSGAVALDAQARIILDRIDATVSAASHAGANLVKSGSSDVSLSVQAAGGEILAAVQALDSKALGLTGIDLSTFDGAHAAVGRIDAAISESFIKSQRIGALSRVFSNQGEFLGALETVRADNGSTTLRTYGASGGASGGSLQRGRFVNIIA